MEHKNYDVQATKTDVDYQITKDQYLSESERQEKEAILLQVAASEIPSEVFDCFRVVGSKDKLILDAVGFVLFAAFLILFQILHG